MLGILYLTSSIVSHVGARIKEGIYNRNAKVNPETNCYRDFYGHLRDNTTYEHRIDTFDHNGDYVLTDLNRNVVRNISEERRIQECAKRRNSTDRDMETETTICTRKERIVKVYNPQTKSDSYIQGIVYRDIDNGKDYFKISVYVPSDYCDKAEDKLFYVDINKPFDLIRMSDEQKKYEQISKKYNKYNWIDSAEDGERFIKDYNNWPYQMDATHSFAHTKKSFIHCL